MRFVIPTAVLSAILAAASAAPTALALRALGITVNATAAGNASTNGTVNSFADSCKTYGVHQVKHDAFLGAYCRDGSGDSPYSSINLNHCIANDAGIMVARQDGNFAQSCNRMLIHGARPVLYAFCNNGRYPQETVIDLGDFVDNDNGRLHCFGRYAE
ncbi:Cyanovirin-N [Nemania sp. FL0031]|nr:Cyanovirin-N [Nemania sp. FL0031]